MDWTSLYFKTSNLNVFILGTGEVASRRANKFLDHGANVKLAGNSLSDDLDHIKNLIEDDIMSEDPTSIAIDNNIEQHYIAECEECKGVFISAVVKSDQKVDKISGICPLCEKSTDQYLRWVIVDANEA